MTKIICLLCVFSLTGCYALSETDALEVAVTYGEGAELAVDPTLDYGDEAEADAGVDQTPTTGSTEPCQ